MRANSQASLVAASTSTDGCGRTRPSTPAAGVTTLAGTTVGAAFALTDPPEPAEPPPDVVDTVAGTVAPPAGTWAAGPPIPGGGNITPLAGDDTAIGLPPLIAAGFGLCAPADARPAGNAGGATDAVPAAGGGAALAGPGNAAAGDIGETTGEVVPPTAAARLNADESTTAPGVAELPDNPEGDLVAPGRLPSPDVNPDNGVPPPKLLDSPPPPLGAPPPPIPPPLNGDGMGAGVAGTPGAIGPPGNSPRSCGSPRCEPPTSGSSAASEMSLRTCGSPCPLPEPPGASPALCKPVCPELPNLSPRCCGSLLSACVVGSLAAGARPMIPAASRPTSFSAWARTPATSAVNAARTAPAFACASVIIAA
ncbi:MAG: hypothetical protein JWR34_5459 [Mycobacterium sp.]|nr:hypothetical protein [Mycobacterium sp.]